MVFTNLWNTCDWSTGKKEENEKKEKENGTRR